MLRSMIAAAALAVCTLPASAQVDPEPLAACMKTHTTPELKTGMKDFMIHALQEHKAEATQALLTFSFSALTIATAKCGLSFGDVQTPYFESAMERYGEMLGEEIMSDAFLMLDIPVD